MAAQCTVPFFRNARRLRLRLCFRFSHFFYFLRPITRPRLSLSRESGMTEANFSNKDLEAADAIIISAWSS
jgi:hypothetical protein